jgi:4-diphosphocytidyl-2-C-methyl-D-erythritol kinase
MRGIGEMVEPLEGSPALPAMPAVLVNPGRPLATPEVFRALAAAPLGADERAPLAVSVPLDAGGLAALMRERGNDLEGPATALLPAIADIKAALSSQAGCLVAAMSGSGPTCFGIFTDAAAAARAAATLAHYDPRWWVVETRLGA